MKRRPCERCGKSHYTVTGRDACARKAARLECVCPPYWRRRWPSHSKPHGCPLADTPANKT